MKKLIAICLSFVMLVCCVSAFAEEDFVDSPIGNQGPSLITGIISNPECEAHIVITPYSQRNTLEAEALAEIEAAFEEIAATADLSQLNQDFASFVESLGIAGEALAVSDLFDVSYVGCLIHNSHGSYSITLAADNLDKFVGLLHNIGGAWDYVDNAVVSADSTTLSFTVSSLSPFAIVVDTTDVGGDESSEEISDVESSDVESSEVESSEVESSEVESSEVESSEVESVEVEESSDEVIEESVVVPDESITVPDEETPDTGDNHNYVWAIILAIAALVVGVLVFKKRRA